LLWVRQKELGVRQIEVGYSLFISAAGVERTK